MSRKLSAEEQDIADLFKDSLSKLPLFDENHRIYVDIEGNDIHIGYTTVDRPPEQKTTRFHGQITDGTCYILTFERHQEAPRGYGNLLYDAIEEFARNFGCKRIELTGGGMEPPFWRKYGLTEIREIWEGTFIFEKQLT